MGDIKRTLFEPSQYSTGPGPLEFGPRQPGALETAIGGALQVAEKYVGNKAQLEINNNKLKLLEQQEQVNTEITRITEDYVSTGDIENFLTNSDALLESNFGSDSPWYNSDMPGHEELRIKTKAAIDRMYIKAEGIAIDRNSEDISNKLDFRVKTSKSELDNLYSDWKSYLDIDTSNMSPEELDNYMAEGELYEVSESEIYRSLSEVSNYTHPKTGQSLIDPSRVVTELDNLGKLSSSFMTQRTVSEAVRGLSADKQVEVLDQMLLDLNSGDASVIYRDDNGQYVRGTSGSNYSDSDGKNLRSNIIAARENARAKANEIKSKRKNEAEAAFKSQQDIIRQRNNNTVSSAGKSVSELSKPTRAVSIKVLDADTVVYAPFGGQERKLRINYIDADEMSVEEGQENKDRLKELLESGEAYIIHTGYDFYNRELGDIIVGGRRVSSVALEEEIASPYSGPDILQPVYGKMGLGSLQKSLDLDAPEGAYTPLVVDLPEEEKPNYSESYSTIFKNAIDAFKPSGHGITPGDTPFEVQQKLKKELHVFTQDLHKQMAGELSRKVTADQYASITEEIISQFDIQEREGLYKLYADVKKSQEDSLIRNSSLFVQEVYPFVHKEFTDRLQQIDNDSTLSLEQKTQASSDAQIRLMEDTYKLATKHVSTDRVSEVEFFSSDLKRDMERRQEEGQPNSKILRDTLFTVYGSVSPNYKSVVLSELQDFIPEFIDVPEGYNETLKSAIPGILVLSDPRFLGDEDPKNNPMFSIFDINKADVDLYNETVSSENRYNRQHFLNHLEKSSFLNRIPFGQRETVKNALALQAEAEAIKGTIPFESKRDSSGSFVPSHSYTQKVMDLDKFYNSQYVQVSSMSNSVVSKHAISNLSDEGRRSWFNNGGKSAFKIKRAESYIKMEPQLVNHLILPEGSYMTREEVIRNSRLKFNSDSEGNVIVSLIDKPTGNLINIEGENGSPIPFVMDFDDFYYRYDSSSEAAYKHLTKVMPGSGYAPGLIHYRTPFKAEEVESIETAPAYTKPSNFLTYSGKEARERKGVQDHFLGFHFVETAPPSYRYETPAEFTDFFKPKDQFGEFIPLPLKSQLEKPRFQESDLENFGVVGGGLFPGPLGLGMIAAQEASKGTFGDEEIQGELIDISGDSSGRVSLARSSGLETMIMGGESYGGEIDTYAGAPKGQGDPSIPTSTVSENIKKYKNKALGRYQIQGNTAKYMLKRMGEDPNTFMFDAEGQERIFEELLKYRGIDKYMSGEITLEEFAHNLSKEWAALPEGLSNESFYKDEGDNTAHFKWDELLSKLRKMKSGGG